MVSVVFILSRLECGDFAHHMGCRSSPYFILSSCLERQVAGHPRAAIIFGGQFYFGRRRWFRRSPAPVGCWAGRNVAISSANRRECVVIHIWLYFEARTIIFANPSSKSG